MSSVISLRREDVWLHWSLPPEGDRNVLGAGNKSLKKKNKKTTVHFAAEGPEAFFKTFGGDEYL